MSGPGKKRDDGGATVIERETKTIPKLQRPKRYKVLLHNDDFTTQEFVDWVLMNVFNHDPESAHRIMLNVHMRGIGVAGVYTYEIAEMKVSKTTELARENEFPLLCTMEKA